MSDEKMKNKFFMLFLEAISGILFIIIVVGEMNMQRIKNEFVQCKIDKSNLDTDNLNLKNSNTLLKAQIKSISIELNNIINDNLELKEDMIGYIKRDYPKTSTVVANAIAETVIQKSDEHNISSLLVFAMIEEESWFTPTAKSKAGAIGLMQVMPEWIPKLDFIRDENDLYEIDKSIDAGIHILKIHIDEQKGSLEKGLYYYVNKDKKYSGKIFAAVGRFAIYRSSKIIEKGSSE